MKPVRLWIAVLLGVLASFLMALLLSLLVTWRPFIFLPEPFKALFSSHLIEGGVGAFIAGYLAKKRGTRVGVFVSYSFLLIAHLFYWIWAIIDKLSSWARSEKLFTGEDLYLRTFLAASVVFVGLIAGLLGELVARPRPKIPQP